MSNRTISPFKSIIMSGLLLLCTTLPLHAFDFFYTPVHTTSHKTMYLKQIDSMWKEIQATDLDLLLKEDEISEDAYDQASDIKKELSSLYQKIQLLKPHNDTENIRLLKEKHEDFTKLYEELKITLGLKMIKFNLFPWP